MRPLGSTVERELARIAHSAHGVVTRQQLLAAGITVAEIKRRLRTGALIREHRAVYRVGHRAPSVEARYLAAVLACGDGALLSGRAAGYLLGLIKRSEPAPEVTAPGGRRVPGVTSRRSPRITEDGIRWRGIPVTSVARTVVDLAAQLSPADLGRVCHEATVLFGTTPADIEKVLARRPNSPGARRLRQTMNGDVRVTLSRLEDRFLQLLAEAGIPLPKTNRRVGRWWVDCRWPDHQLTVELDSYRYHRSRHAWEQDRRRERDARARGDDYRRYIWSDVFESPRLTVGELRDLLDGRLAA